MAFALDVVVDVHAHLFPLGEDVRVDRQRTQRRAVDGLECAQSRTGQLSERARIEPLEPLGDGVVELGQGEEGAVAQCGEDPALDDLNTDLDLGLVNYLQMQAVPPDGMIFGASA